MAYIRFEREAIELYLFRNRSIKSNARRWVYSHMLYGHLAKAYTQYDDDSFLMAK